METATKKEVERSDGMHFIEQILKELAYERKPRIPKDTICGSFGIIDDSGYPNIIHWKISAFRAVKRAGVVGGPIKADPYCTSLFGSMFKNW